jgi:hypothetical protein
MKDAGVFRHGQIGAEGQFLEDAADAVPLRRRYGVGAADIVPVDAYRPAVGRQRPGQDVHQGGLSGAIVTDKPDAFASADGQVDRGKGLDGAEALLHAVQAHNRLNRLRHALQWCL